MVGDYSLPPYILIKGDLFFMKQKKNLFIKICGVLIILSFAFFIFWNAVILYKCYCAGVGESLLKMATLFLIVATVSSLLSKVIKDTSLLYMIIFAILFLSIVSVSLVMTIYYFVCITSDIGSAYLYQLIISFLLCISCIIIGGTITDTN